MDLVESYWRGVRQRLQAEVDVFARLIQHRGEQGRENEQALARLLGNLLPQRLGLGSGLVIDNTNHASKQTDLLLFDQADEPRIFAQATQLLFPVETVLACIEVKTSLSGDEIGDCFAKKRSLLQLTPCRAYASGHTHPLFVVLAYSTTLLPSTIFSKLMEASPPDRPDLICVVNCGFLGGQDGSLKDAPTKDFHAGYTLLMDHDGTDFVKRPPKPPGRLHLYHGHLYLAVEYQGIEFLTDPARALLLFAEALMRRVDQRQCKRESIMSLYLSERARSMVWLERGTSAGGLTS